MNRIRNKDILTYNIMLLSGLCFYLIPGKWISIEDDTASYLYESGREGVMPGYPAFLAFLKSILGEQYFLHGAVIIQSLLAVICTFLFVLVLKKQFKLRGIESVLLYFLSMLPFSIYLPEVGITHQIMTEGITYAIFYLFFITAIKAVWMLDYRWYLGCELIAVLLGFIRSQLLLLQAVCLLLFLWISIKKFGKKIVGKACACLLILAVILGMALGNKMKNVSMQFNTVLVARGFYEADEADVDLFKDDMMQEIFMRTYQLADEDEKRYEYATPGLYMWQDLVYDRMLTYVLQAVDEYDTFHAEERIRDYRSIAQELGGKVLIRHFDRYLYHSIRLMIPSFIASVFFQIKPIYLLCHFIALFLYLLAIGINIWVYKKGGNKEVVKMMNTTLFILISIVVMVNLLFIGLQRYVVYGMGIFYCSGYLLLREIFLIYWKRKADKCVIYNYGKQ